MNRFIVIISLNLLICSCAERKIPPVEYSFPFAEEIAAFKQQDSLQPPPKGAILFVGSSSFRLWNTLQPDFAGFTVINRGFGGASLPDVIEYAEEVIYPYDPRQIIVYCGENDLAASDAPSAQTVSRRFQELFRMIRREQPNVPIAFVSIKPSPSRAHLIPKIREANRLIRDFLSREHNTRYVDVFSKMINDAGRPSPEIFTEDSLHMNAKGYVIWKAEIGKVLLRK
jgi:lysophospholipase L1-like esterase